MLEIVNLEEKRQSLVKLKNRGPNTPEAAVEAAFSTLGIGDFRDCCVFLGSFDGNAGWERHLKGDELVQVLDGETEFDIIIEDERQTVTLKGGMLVVVPQGCWHRFRSVDGITVLTATPRHDEEHTFVDDPRDMVPS
jgi:mannose-6-phosphate isomerase-like protein (cupin superfamily)